MAFGVTSEGFKAKKYSDILSELSTSLKTELGIDIDANPDSVAKVLTNIISLALAEEWALPQALQSMFDIDKAEGKHLDDLVGYISLSRLKAAPSNGNVYITANKEMVIPINSVFKDNNENTYINNNTINIVPTNCVKLVLTVDPLAGVGDILTVTVGGVDSSVTITSNVSAAVLALITNITNKSNGVTAKNTTEVNQISIQTTNDKAPSNILFSNNLSIVSVTSFGNVARANVGNYKVSAGDITVPPNLTGITSVTNRYDFTTGRFVESDIDLRNRHTLSVSTAGAATVKAIRADLLGITGVTSAIVIENDSLIIDSDGIPEKAFLSVVKGGVEQDIGDALWKTKGAGIETYGKIIVPVVDSQGNVQAVKFSRPNPIYVHMHIDYSIYQEEADEFPSDGEYQMLSTILSYGDALVGGEDVIPQRFSSNVFNSIGGLSMVNITVGSTVSPNDPTPTLSTTPLPIDVISEADFSEGRITFSEV